MFFPTEKETFLGFLIQGPYRTTPARDNIPEYDPSNQALVRETAALLCDVLRELRDDGLLTVDVLQALPLDAARFQPGTMFRPLFESVRTALAQEELIPVAGGAYGAAAALKLARGAGLRELLVPDQLGVLYGAASLSPSRVNPSPRTGRLLCGDTSEMRSVSTRSRRKLSSGGSRASFSCRSRMRGSAASTRSSIRTPLSGGRRDSSVNSLAPQGQDRSSGSRTAAI